MERLISILLLLSAFALPARAQDKCRIHVTLPANVQGGHAELLDWDILSCFDKIDSVSFSGREFTLDVNCREQPFMAMIRTFDRQNVGLGGRFIIIEQGNLDIVIKHKDDILVSGTPLNDIYYEEVIEPWQQRHLERNYALKNERERRIAAKTWSQEEESDYMHRTNTPALHRAVQKEDEFMRAHMHLPGVVGEYVQGHGMIEKPDLSGWPREYADSVKAYWAAAEARTQKFISENPPGFPEKDVPDSVAVGRKFVDVSGVRPNGSTVTLAELVRGNKITVLDFWASWCAPCLREMPFMRSLHEEFEGQGVAIVGISIDARDGDWRGALGNHDMPWMQMLSREAGNAYYVNSIPYTIVLDSNGVIVARRLRGEALKKEITTLLQLD